MRDLIEPPQGGEEGSARPKPGPRKSADYQSSVRHWADLCGAEVSPVARELARSDTTLALRAAFVARDEGRFAAFHHPAYRARWAEAIDLSERDVVRRLLAEAGLDGDASLARAESEEIGDRLARETEGAIARGVFGVPTLFVGDEMFWGNDRFELVRHYLTRTA